MKRLWGVIVLSGSLLAGVSQADVTLRTGKPLRIDRVDAVTVRFGGDTTPECRLAVSTDGRRFFFKEVGSTCRRLTNSKGVKIVCNRTKKVCKTRREIAEFVLANAAEETLSRQADEKMPSWCRSLGLNRTEHAVCAYEELAELDRKLSKLYDELRASVDEEKQRRWLQRRNACNGDKACIENAYNMRLEMLEHIRKEKEWERKAFSLYTKMCEKERQADYCLKTASAYAKGTLGQRRDEASAFYYYKKACEYGSDVGCNNAGVMSANAEGTSRDLYEARRYLQKACAMAKRGTSCRLANEVDDMIRNRETNAFRGIRKNDCYRLKPYALQRICLEGTGGDACYGLSDDGLQRVCREGSGGSACYGLKDIGLQRVCREGVGTSACYALQSVNQQQSCRRFNGSTAFWLMLAAHGYYTY